MPVCKIMVCQKIFSPKLVAISTSLEGWKKRVRSIIYDQNTYHLMKKIVKIGPVDSEIIGLQ